MRFNLKQLFFVFLILGAISYSIVFVVNRAVRPLISEDRFLDTDITYQKALEKRIENNLFKLLSKLYGKKNIIVSVVTHLHQTTEESEQILYEPVIISENYQEKYEGEFESFKKALLSKKPDPSEIRRQLEESRRNAVKEDLEFPGLLPQKNLSPRITQSLPGFPFVEQPRSSRSARRSEDLLNLQENLLAGADQDNAATTKNRGGADSEGKGRSSTSFTKQTTGDVIYYNQTKIKSSTPNRAVEKMFVSVLIDERRFQLADIDRSVIEDHIKRMATIKEERGDEFVLSIFQFPNTSMDLGSMYLRYKPQVVQILELIPQFKWVFISILIVIILGIMVVIGFMIAKVVRQKRELRRQEQLREDETNKEQMAEKEATVFEQKKDDIVKLAKSKPQDFAKVILNWVEKSNN